MKSKATIPSFKRRSSIDIESNKEFIGDYIIERLMEYFATDEIIQLYIENNNKFNDRIKELYISEVVNNPNWVVSVFDYDEILDYIRETLPKKFSKKGNERTPWFDNVMPIIDMLFWPKTLEQAALENMSTNAKSK